MANSSEINIKKILYSCIFVMVSVCSSCQSANTDKYTAVLKNIKQFELGRLNEWKVDICIPNGNNYILEFIKNKGNLTYKLKGNYCRTETGAYEYKQVKQIIISEKGNVKQLAILTSKSDTIQIYQYCNKTTANPVFIKGKYNFLYEMGKLSPEQEKFYLTHKKFLDKIRGNNLPILPGLILNEDEKGLFYFEPIDEK